MGTSKETKRGEKDTRGDDEAATAQLLPRPFSAAFVAYGKRRGVGGIVGATLFHTGLSPAVTPSTPLNGACHSGRAPPGFNWSREGEERGSAGEKRGWRTAGRGLVRGRKKMKYKSSSEKAGEQGLGRTCVEDTNASYTNFSLSPFPLHPPLSKPRIRDPGRAEERHIGPGLHISDLSTSPL